MLCSIQRTAGHYMQSWNEGQLLERINISILEDTGKRSNMDRQTEAKHWKLGCRLSASVRFQGGTLPKKSPRTWGSCNFRSSKVAHFDKFTFPYLLPTKAFPCSQYLMPHSTFRITRTSEQHILFSSLATDLGREHAISSTASQPGLKTTLISIHFALKDRCR